MHTRRNFLPTTGLHSNTQTASLRRTAPFLALRSLLPIAAVAIPRRYSSSSLPPSFVSGRFAGFLSSAHRAHTGVEV